MRLSNLPGPGDFSPPDPECVLMSADDFPELKGIDWCLEHEQPWSECGGQSDD